jgi:hypothetical protein
VTSPSTAPIEPNRDSMVPRGAPVGDWKAGLEREAFAKLLGSDVHFASMGESVMSHGSTVARAAVETPLSERSAVVTGPLAPLPKLLASAMPRTTTMPASIEGAATRRDVAVTGTGANTEKPVTTESGASPSSGLRQISLARFNWSRSAAVVYAEQGQVEVWMRAPALEALRDRLLEALRGAMAELGLKLRYLKVNGRVAWSDAEARDLEE